MLRHLKEANVAASDHAPKFNQFGGIAPNGFKLKMTASEGDIYFTTDGSDPRTSYSGSVSASAKSYDKEQGLSILRSTEESTRINVKARSLNGGTWSALTGATFMAGDESPPIRFSEIMYNPQGGNAFEFIELKNVSGAPLDLAGASFSGVRFTFDEGTLAPWESGVLIPNDAPAAFIAKYPDAPILGTYGGSLSNSGEELRLLDPDGQIVFSVNYSADSPWPSEADGVGSSLELVSQLASERDPANWRASLVPGGTPGDILFLSTELSLTGGRMAIRFLALPGNTYSLHTSDDLASGKWRKLEANEFVTRMKVVEFVVSPDDGEGQQFYRVSSL